MRSAPNEADARARLAYAALLAAVTLWACGVPAASPPPVEPRETGPQLTDRAPRTGLWVPCEGSARVLDHPGSARALLDTARALGVTDLFVQVYRGGRAWFDSSLADATPYRDLLERGPDPLRTLVADAHEAGLRVHAWVNVLSLGAHRDGPLLARLGPGSVQTDREGRSLLDYPDLQVPGAERRWVRVGTPAIWIDPGAPEVAPRIAEVFAELAARYPALDGLHLDYIRYPDVLPFTPGARFDVGLDFGFGDQTRARFREQTGLDAPFGRDSRHASAFDAWRRAQVTALVREIGAAARRARPGLELSAAVWAYPERAYLSLMQDWSLWLDEGLLDFAVAMAYARDERLFTLQLRTSTAAGGPRLWIGLGAWLFSDDPPGAARQLERARAVAPQGVALFSYDALAASPALAAALSRERVP